MSKFFLFLLLTWLLGNPFLALIVIILLIYVLDRRYVGLFPSLTKSFKRSQKVAKLRQELRLNPHNASSRLELARLLAEKKEYGEAGKMYKDLLPIMEDSAEVRCELGMVLLKLGQLDEGEQYILHGLSLNARVKFGEPYLRLGEAYCGLNQDKALHYLEQFRSIHSSSCEAYFHLGVLYEKMEKTAEAKIAYTECVNIYKSLPKYRKRFERKWAVRSWFKKLFK